MTHAKVHDNHIEMTVIDPAALKLFQKLSIKITTELAELLASFKILKRQLSDPPQYEEAAAPEPEPEAPEPEPEVEAPEPEAEEDEKLIEHPALAAAAIAKAWVNKSLLSPPNHRINSLNVAIESNKTCSVENITSSHKNLVTCT